MIPIYVPYIDKYKTSALKAIETNWISNHGTNVSNAEEVLRARLGVKYCILMNNGTAATHALFICLKHKHPNIQKIYVPNNVFIACWNCALMQYDKNQLEVMKLNDKTLNIDTSKAYIDTLEPNSAVLIVHNLGNVVNVPRLKRLRPDLTFVEDNCEGLFGKYENEFTGCSESSLCSAASFYGNKILTSGEGGAFFTNDLDVYNFMKSTYSHGMSSMQRYIHNKLAYNYRMTNVQAGFVYDQLQDLDHILSVKLRVMKAYDTYLEALIKAEQIQKLTSDINTEPAAWMYCILIPHLDYPRFEQYMTEHGVQVRPLFYDIRKHQHLKDVEVKYAECTTAANGAMLPSFPGLLSTDQEYICNRVKQYVRQDHA